MNNVTFAMLGLGISEILLMLLVVLFWVVVVGGIVLLAVWLARRGKTKFPVNPQIQQREQPMPASAKSEAKKSSFVEVKDGRPHIRWGIYFLGLSVAVIGSALLNGCLLAVGVWSGMDTVLFGIFVVGLVFNVWVIYEFNQAGAAGPVNNLSSGSALSGGSPRPNSPAPEDSASTATCPRCGSSLPANSPQGLCPRCVLGIGLATQTEATASVGPHGTKIIKPPPAPDEIGKHFPQLEILECLGRGGMGVVYKARQPKLNRIVALKILAPEKEAEPRFAERFLREAQTLARLNHPNIVTVHDFGETDGLCYLLMEFVDGLTLRQMMREGRMLPEAALAIVPKICEALQFAHEQGVVHRDIKPENVLVDKLGRVKIADFGIAKIVGEAGRAGSPLPAEATPTEGSAPGGTRPTTALTQDQVLGTPQYMAPEQVEHPQTVDHRADIYSLGVVFYELLTGELPGKPIEPPSRKVQIDVRLDEVVLRALEKQPERRYQQASQVKTAVEEITQAPAPSATATPPGKTVTPATPRYRWFAPVVVVRNGQRVIHWPGVVQDSFLLAGIYGVAWVACAVLVAPHFGMPSVGSLIGGAVGFVMVILTRGFFLGWHAPLDRLATLDEKGQVKPAVTPMATTPPHPAAQPASPTQRTSWSPFTVVGIRDGQRTIHWPGLVRGWLVVTFVGGLGLAELIALMGQPFSLREMVVTVVLVAWAAFVVMGVRVKWSWSLPLDRLPNLDRPLPPGGYPASPSRPPSATPSDWPRTIRRAVFVGLAVCFITVGLAITDTVTRPKAYWADAWVGVKEVWLTPSAEWAEPRFERRDPNLLYAEREVIESELVLAPVIQQLQLEERWGPRYGGKQKLTKAETLQRLKAGTFLRLDHAASLIKIGVSDELPDEAAELANAIADRYAGFRAELLRGFKEHLEKEGMPKLTAPRLCRVEIVERAVLPLQPVDSNWPLSLLDAIGAVILGGLAALITGFVAWGRQRRAHAMPARADQAHFWRRFALAFAVVVLGLILFAMLAFILFTRIRPLVTRMHRASQVTSSVATSAEMKPRPDLDESKWGTIEDPKAARWAVLAAAFGPEKEVTLTEFNNRDGQVALDLDTGTVFKQPKDMDQWSEEGLGQWVKENGVDLFVDHGPGGGWGLVTTTDAELKLARLENDKWRVISAAELDRVLAGSSTPLSLVTPGRMKIYPLPPDAPPPMTFAFKTSSGGLGVLQVIGYTDKPRGVKLRYKQVPAAAAASGSRKPEDSQRRFVRLVVDKTALTFEGQPTTWDDVGALLEKVPERKTTVLEFAVTSDQITVQQQNEWLGKCLALAHGLGFEYASFIGVHPLGSKGTPASSGGATGATSFPAFGPVIERVLAPSDADDQGLVFFDLETGSAFKPPFPLKLHPNQGPALVELTPELKQWIQARDVDVLFHLGEKHWDMMTLETQAGLGGQLQEWETIPPEQVIGVFAKKDADHLVSGEVPAASFGHSYRDGFGAFSAFRTRSHTLGVYQFEGVDNSTRRGVGIRYKVVQTKPAAATARRTPEPSQRKFVRLVVGKEALTFEGQPTNWDDVGALLEKVPERKHTVLECALASAQVADQQATDSWRKCNTLAKDLGFEYANFIGIRALGSTGTAQSNWFTASGPFLSGPGLLSGTLPDGVSIQLVGLTDYPAKGGPSWQPDGQPLPTPMFDQPDLDVRSLQLGDERIVELALAITGLKSGDACDATLALPRRSFWAGKKLRNGVVQSSIIAAGFILPTNAAVAHITVSLDATGRVRLERATFPSVASAAEASVPLLQKGETGITFRNVSLMPGYGTKPQSKPSP